MNSTMRFAILSALLAFSASSGTLAQQANTTFFVTSTGPGKGADLGGLAGADRLCQQLAQAVGASHTWHAYLSTQAADGQTAVNARDRIGCGPWQNSKGVTIAKDLDELHGANNLTKQTALTEKGDVVNGRGDTPNKHDALTGSQPDGKAFPPGEDWTCHNWTSSTQAAAMVGHIDRQGLRDDDVCRNRGIPRTPRAAPTAAAARPTSAAPAATACSTVSPSMSGKGIERAGTSPACGERSKAAHSALPGEGQAAPTGAGCRGAGCFREKSPSPPFRGEREGPVA